MLTLAYVGTEGHRLISQTEANPSDPGLCRQLTAQGYSDTTNGATGDSATSAGIAHQPQLHNDGLRRKDCLNPNLLPAAGSLCFGFGNTFTKLVANSIYHSGELTVSMAGDVTFLAAYLLAKAIDDSSAFGELINFQNAKLSRGLSSTDIHQNFVVGYLAAPSDRLHPTRCQG